MAARSSATWTVDVRRAPEDVFAYLTDVRRHAEWSRKAYRIEALSDGPIRKGTTFTSYGWVPKDPDHRNDVEVTEYETPSRFTLVSREASRETVNQYELTPVDGGTRVRRRMDMPTPAGAAGAVFPLFLAGFIKPAVGKGMKLFKQNLERTA